MSSLPSFVDLMASLGLSSSGQSTISNNVHRDPSSSPPPTRSPPALHVPISKSSSNIHASPAIVVSQYESESSKSKGVGEPRRRASSGSIRAARFNPYGTASRRGSMSTVADAYESDCSQSSSTASSRRSSINSVKQNASHRKDTRVRRQLSQQLSIVTSASCAPISSFARRRSPQTSPTSPVFAQRRARSASAEVPTPVSLPTLPPLLAESFAGYSFSSSTAAPAASASATGSTDQRRERRSHSPSPMVVCEYERESSTFVKHHQGGLRISSLCRPDHQVHPVQSRHVSPIA